MNIIREEVEFDGIKIEIETGKIAKQADAALTVKCGGTVVMIAVVSTDEMTKDLDYFPLTVNYADRYYASGKIPGGFIKRETKPGDREILVSRLIDRPIRPLFPEDFRNEVQVTAVTLSSDQSNPPDILAIIGVSAALNISEIPFKKILGAIRVGRIDGQFVANPTFQQMQLSDMDIIVAASKDAILMVEGGGKEVLEKDVLDAIKFAHQKVQPIIEMQERFVKKLTVKKKEYDKFTVNEDIRKSVKEKFDKELLTILQIKDKRQRNKVFEKFVKTVISQYKPEDFGLGETELSIHIKTVLEEMEDFIVRDVITNKKGRLDGRKFDQIRDISVEINVLPRTHGSALFTRGQTQSLGVLTLGTVKDAQRFDDIEGEYTKNFMLHYNFPPFSVGECGRSGAPGRREIGHGMLAQRSLVPVLPDPDKFPYTLRLVSEILESNGSSSMASICSGCLAMLQAGVPVKASVAGIAMGLVKTDKDFFILSDIAGSEDHYGDMDFKVAGTEKGVTGLQMDIKIDGLTFEIMEKALEQARAGRMHILGEMNKVISKPNDKISELAPRIITMTIDTSKIREVIGSGGNVIREIIDQTDTDIDIDDSGEITIAGKDLAAVEKAKNIIEGIVAEPEIGKTYSGVVKKILDFGMIVEFLSTKSGMVHISRIADQHVRRIEDYYKLGDPVNIKIIKIDFERGKQKNDLAIVHDKK